MDILNREKREIAYRRAVKRAFKPFRKSEKNRQPAWGRMKKQLLKDLQPLHDKQRLDAARGMFAKHGTAPVDPSWRPPADSRVEDMVDDMIAVSKQKWKELDRPLKREDVLKWRARWLGNKRSEMVAATEVTFAHQSGEDAAWAHMRDTQGVLLEGIWKTEANPCPFCTAMKNKPSAFWRQYYPQGPPQPHPACRCYIKHYEKTEAALKGTP